MCRFSARHPGGTYLGRPASQQANLVLSLRPCCPRSRCPMGQSAGLSLVSAAPRGLATRGSLRSRGERRRLSKWSEHYQRVWGLRRVLSNRSEKQDLAVIIDLDIMPAILEGSHGRRHDARDMLVPAGLAAGAATTHDVRRPGDQARRPWNARFLAFRPCAGSAAKTSSADGGRAQPTAQPRMGFPTRIRSPPRVRVLAASFDRTIRLWSGGRVAGHSVNSHDPLSRTYPAAGQIKPSDDGRLDLGRCNTSIDPTNSKFHLTA